MLITAGKLNSLPNLTVLHLLGGELSAAYVGLQQGSSSSIPPLLDQSKGSYVSEVIDKTELFNDVFINQNATLNESSFPIGPTPVASTFNLDAVTPEEVKNGLKSLPSKTSVGEDGISYRLLQEVGPGVVGPLVSLFNKSISLGKCTN